MNYIVVEVLNQDKIYWDEVSRYDVKKTYESTRHAPPQTLTGKKMAYEDASYFIREYERSVRVTEWVESEGLTQ